MGRGYCATDRVAGFRLLNTFDLHDAAQSFGAAQSPRGCRARGSFVAIEDEMNVNAIGSAARPYQILAQVWRFNTTEEMPPLDNMVIKAGRMPRSRS